MSPPAGEMIILVGEAPFEVSVALKDHPTLTGRRRRVLRAEAARIDLIRAR